MFFILGSYLVATNQSYASEEAKIETFPCTIARRENVPLGARSCYEINKNTIIAKLCSGFICKSKKSLIKKDKFFSCGDEDPTSPGYATKEQFRSNIISKYVSGLNLNKNPHAIGQAATIPDYEISFNFGKPFSVMKITENDLKKYMNQPSARPVQASINADKHVFFVNKSGNYLGASKDGILASKDEIEIFSDVIPDCLKEGETPTPPH